ncbi:PREDICTED: uncharacterized protein LOC109233831 [Nicotiana attenuata]|uniref:Uncharacterized protein n=1 Tax=Nicotiana attenuata TaxID=49451 RepID=A0A1J6HYY2_NICAT|nr:PREDICTED: uncharacterized protein LOC109233831 [Nicotiana attenuata]OIS97553.1 hypothetical protein A4A49_07323 [Nicotiana attenuata]
MISVSLLSKMSIYDVNIGGDTVITRVADRIAIVNLGISELKAELNSSDSIVGIDSINDLANNNTKFGGDLLLLYVKKRCLIIQYSRLLSLEKVRGIPDSLLQFLQDPNIAFVGPRNINTKWLFNSINPGGFNWKFEFRTVVDIGYLAAKVLKKPKLLTSTLEEVEVEAGVDIKKPITSNGAMRENWTFLKFCRMRK